ncbi:efflux RND transporter periplasmic adaptor subunit [Pedobacter cryoconitis]|uniref:Multidrug efflux pump subunit AcrA (Membrane-fusion protein) n=1 Tax=Pedobacter cryoconitis TaxID=188932 RepID=A0A7X0IZQ7_9SPHI|nr:HlyD family efflux transporter periplasmic adaptor subunit [Pedobacter cryoconitis]MBB6498415.1 multidrug efflux pump subunit AcrA (membrane-fusion protein) [Pedobacter cryoconitis]
MKQTIINAVFISLFSLVLISCQSDSKKSAAEETVVPKTPVQVVSVANSTLSDDIVLNATSTYLEKSVVKANTNGYLQSATIQAGAIVGSNQVLFKIITKEARAIGNSINELDPGFKFSGVSAIRAEKSGFVTSVSHQKGDYVQDGEALATIINQSSLVFLLDLPYEMRSVILQNKTLEITLPDGEKLKGIITSSLPAVDSLAQTQRMIIKVNASHPIPENLVGKVRVVKSAAANVQVLPKSAVLTNETEDEFWVMKLINDSTAVKTIVKKGMENEQSIQIISPVFNERDRLISVGNYGLADTAKVKIVK